MNTASDLHRWLKSAQVGQAAFAISAILSTGALGAQTQGANLVKNGDAETGTMEGFSVKGATLGVNQGAASNGKFGFELAPSGGDSADAKTCEMASTDLIPVDATKTYKLSAFLKSSGNEQSQQVHFGLIPFDADGKPIISQSVNVVEGTETELTEDFSKESTVLMIRDGGQWKAGPILYVAFEADDSGAYTDLPSRNLSGMGVKSVTQKGDHWEVELGVPAKKGYPAGTKVRLHTAGSSYIYCGVNNKKISREWKEYSGEVGGLAKKRSDSQFWPGTAFVKAVILPGRGADEKLLVDDIMFHEMPH